jgi:hypothetical protein
MSFSRVIPRAPFPLGLEAHDRFRHVHRRRIRGRVGAGDLRHDRCDLGELLDRRVLLARDLDRLTEPDGRVGHGHEHEVALVQRRHEFRADPRDEGGGAGHDKDSDRQRGDTMPQSKVEHRPVEPHERSHHRVVLLAPHPAADEETAQHRDQRHGQNRGADHREGLREGQRVEELALLSGERKDRQEGQDGPSGYLISIILK